MFYGREIEISLAILLPEYGDDFACVYVLWLCHFESIIILLFWGLLVKCT